MTFASKWLQPFQLLIFIEEGKLSALLTLLQSYIR